MRSVRDTEAYDSSLDLRSAGRCSCSVAAEHPVQPALASGYPAAALQPGTTLPAPKQSSPIGVGKGRKSFLEEMALGLRGEYGLLPSFIL